jgi:mitotic spindle assembly checkpoint protein MAD1
LWLDLRVQELESSLVKKELCIKELESSFHVQKEVNTRQYEEIKLLNERLNNEARRIKSLEREGDWLRSKVSLLESSYNSSVIEVCNIVNQNPIQCKIQL